jgi:hypothetical protein
VTIPTRITPTRLQAKGWARVGRPGAHLLRRGAWYPVVRISSSHIVVLDVNRRNVPVDRRFLEIRYHPPERWSIVRCEPREIQRVGRLFPLTYAVCPACRHRQAFESDVKEMVCERCKKAATLAWDELS